MIILNAGVPRSGTVLVNAILRQLFERNGVRIGQSNPHGKQLPMLIRRLQQAGHDRHKTILVHTHTWNAETAALVAGSPYVTGFINFRDPRDVCVSLMKLHDHDFDAAAQMVETNFRIFEQASQAACMMVIPYELLIADRPGHIFQIARRLGLWPGLDEIAEIDAATSVDTHKAVMDKVNSGEMDGLTRRQNTNRVMTEDSRTLINDRHIQSGAKGRWRDELTDAQQNAANERFHDILTRYGYEL
ncbi:MAG: hypothetical protein AAFP68_05890 [Pseudomonadota bacterium]